MVTWQPRVLAAIVVMLASTLIGLSAESTPLIEAVRSGDMAAARRLIDRRSGINATEPDGMTALHWTVRANDVDTSRRLIAAGARAGAVNRYGMTPLHLAATNGSAALTALLLSAGADPNATLPEGESVLMTAARTGDVGVVKALVSQGARVNASEGWLGETALMWAASEDHADAVRVLVELGADVNARSSERRFPDFAWATTGMVTTALPRGRWTPLMYAARDGAIEAARALAASHADLNATDPDGTTALNLAIINAQYDLAVALIEAGADTNVADVAGMTPLYAAVDMHTLGSMIGRPVPVPTGMRTAVDVVKSLLAHGADPNARLKRPLLMRHHDAGDASMGEDTTALMRAAKTNDLELLRVLLAGGADPFAVQKDFTTVAMIAAAGGARPGSVAEEFAVSEDGALAALTVLLDRGVDVNAFNANGQTALHGAAGRGADAVVSFLVRHGARMDRKDRQGRIPLDVALGVGARRGSTPHESTATLLRQLQAEKAQARSTQGR